MLDTRARFRWLVAIGWVLCAGAPGTAAQLPIGPAPAATAAPAPDPLGRESPFGTVTGFSTAVHRGDLALAAQYLEGGGRRQPDLQALARDLNDLLDRYFTAPLTSLSRLPSGDLADGLGANRDRIPLTIGGRPADLFLTRVEQPGGTDVWLISSDSLGRVPALRRSPQATWIERVMPASLIARSYLDVSLAQWILWVLSIAIPLLLFWTLTVLVLAAGRRRIRDAARFAVFRSWWNGVRWLIVCVLTLFAHLAAMPLLGFSLTFRYAYGRVGLVFGILVTALLIWRLLSVTFHHARLLAMRRGRSDTQSLIGLGERVVKVVVVLVAVFGLLALAGVDATTALAGLGIVSVAVALGAQKSVDNLLGGFFLLTDRALAVGDYCRLSDREGWVEDITLRSVRLRTLEQTLVSVPAGQLAQGSIENFASRRKMLVQTTLRLRYDTAGDRLQAVLDGSRQVLAGHVAVEAGTARIRLVAFGAQAIELELFAYVLTAEYPVFLEIREALLLQIARIVESCGAAFARPTEFIHVGAAPDEARVAAAGGVSRPAVAAP